ncbi:hypothetical protein W97_09065 [Coniosporium apollinis CBS 100218]|uniref:Uncharacterized protein n=1 Tax=Coniosporium apollinis (strain CBS 100218) TaxID=1168221 RepID=R7Z6K5_CONA1|nr:uncharacterized protein W97_09065 [Coniosporium apollinis CBS 100218]EON69802.1 hypothetical protein W97_09065 [Coniosporium apollinis CBS 100218]
MRHNVFKLWYARRTRLGAQVAKSLVWPTRLSTFDDQTSTSIIPAGSGFEVVLCPGGRSTNILASEADQLNELANTGHVSNQGGGGNIFLSKMLLPLLDITLRLLASDRVALRKLREIGVGVGVNRYCDTGVYEHH